MKWTAIVAMVCITALEAIALLRGIDGAVFGIVVAALAGLGGYQVKRYLDIKKGEE